MDDPGNRRPTRVADWIATLFGRNLEFRGARHELGGDRIIRICGVDQGSYVGRQSDGKFSGNPLDLLETTGLDQPGGDEILHAKRCGPHGQVTASRSYAAIKRSRSRATSASRSRCSSTTSARALA